MTVLVLLFVSRYIDDHVGQRRYMSVLFIWLWQAEFVSAAVTVCGGGRCACESGSGIRSPSRSKPAPVSAAARAPPHQTASGEVASSAPPAAGPRATPAVKVRP